MNIPADTPQPGQQPAGSSSTRPLWIAVGLLGATVLAMGSTLLYKQGTPPPPATVAAAAPAMTIATAALPQYPTARQPTAASSPLADDLIEKPAAAEKSIPSPAPAPAPSRHVSKPAHAPAPAPRHAGTAPNYSAPTYSAPAHLAAVPACAVCGSVESVTPMQRATRPAGVSVGTVAGGVLGAVLGNRIGHGNGRAAATVLGAVGGGFAGNAIEGQMRRQTVYQVNVRMQDGSRRTLQVAQAPAVGSAVTVEGKNLQMR